jgi:hypothetical protein
MILKRLLNGKKIINNPLRFSHFSVSLHLLIFISKKLYIRAPKNRLLSLILEKELLIENQSFIGENKRLKNKNKNKK